MAGPPIVSFLEWLANLTKSENFIRKLQVRAADSAKKRLLRGPLRKFDLQHRDAQAEKAFGKQREKGMSLKAILRSIIESRRRNAIRDSVTIKSLKVNKDRTLIKSVSLTYDRSKGRLEVRPHKHELHIIPSSGELHNVSFSKAKRVQWFCDCDDWKFKWEYSMAKRYGATEITHSNGEFPVETNNSLIPGACKHCWVLGNLVLQRGL